MIHCTVCGAAAREGAKFCTSCGARLVDSTPAAPATADDSAPAAMDGDTAAATPVATSATDEPVSAESTWAATVTGEATGETASIPAAPEAPEPAAEEQPADETVAPDYASNWPDPDESNGSEPAADDRAEVEPAATPAAPSAWTSWSAAVAETETESEPVPADRQAAQAEAEPDAPSTEPEDAAAGMEESHHGASQWESWAPAASGSATVPSSTGDAAASVRRLLDDLAIRIDRLIAPASMASREVDPDELADQLDRWHHSTPDSGDLLEVVQAVRKSPRDLDAITRLADRAADLELLVRHYQSITSSSGHWARELRQRKGASADEA